MEPLVALLQGLQHRLLSELKTKARLPVTKCRNLLGVVDETTTLKYGQVNHFAPLRCAMILIIP